MFGAACASLSVLSLLFYFIILPVFMYFRDPKILRKYPNLDLLAGITNLSFMIEAQRGFRSRKLHEMHSKGIPVIRTGPNSLSYGEASVIRVRTLTSRAKQIFRA